ncbi:MAG TPA: YaiI/YqxD family protein [Micropepsaceae bacterium]|nr:YaiI/YqxD family protein [Micropepsaceae bacterium]
MLEIFVDGDACPVKDEVERVAARHNLQVHIVSNGGLRPSRNPQFHYVIAAEGADAADDWIAEHIGSNDIAVTSDLPLAARCLAKGAVVLNPKGEIVSEDRIGMALAMRDLSRHLREVTGRETHHGEFGKKHRSRFLDALENAIQKLRRKN